MTTAVTDTRDKLACMAAGTVPWCDCSGDVAAHIREFKTHKNSHNAHCSTAPRSQRVHEPRD